MDEITLPIYNIEGTQVDTVTLEKNLFDGVVHSGTIHQAISAYRANQRKGLAATKTRGEISGGGKKPWKQKGTGRARVGSTRSPLWRHGGVVFGPHPRDFSYILPKNIRKVALKSVLYAKIKLNNLIVIDSLTIESGKTKDAAKVFSQFKINTRKLNTVLFDKVEAVTRRSLKNLPYLQINTAHDTNVYEVISSEKVFINKAGLSELTKRLK